MIQTGCFSQLPKRRSGSPLLRLVVGGVGVATFLMAAGAASAQSSASGWPIQGQMVPMSVPEGYMLHESVDVGGRVANTVGSGAMYDTLVNEQSGPRVQGETFELRALPGKKGGLVDELKAFASGFGGDSNDFAKLNFTKGKFYDFSGIFRRDRQYFDYDLLGNPNIPGGQTLPIGPSSSPTGSYAWSQMNNSPFLFNTVRRMTDTHLTILPLAKVSFEAGYSQNVFQGPSLTPSGYYVAGYNDILLEEFQRYSTDDFTGSITWKPLPETRLTYEQEVEHYKNNSIFTLAPNYYQVQEADGTKVSLLTSYDNLTPSITCNTSSMINSSISLYASSSGLPVVDPACQVISSYMRLQPTRSLYPTETFRLQSSSIKNVTMNGDVRYTRANMNLPHYIDSFQGLTTIYSPYAPGARSIILTANANARRVALVANYGVAWQATRKLSFSDQIDFSKVQQPGSSTFTSETVQATPPVPGEETVNYPTLTTTTITSNSTSSIEGSSNFNTALPGYFGQKFLTNNLTATWDATGRTTFSLTYSYSKHTIAEGIPHNTPLAVGADTDGTVTINENGGVLTAATRPRDNFSLNGSVEVRYADNVFTVVAPRQLQHYRLHATYRPKPWATLTGAYNDLERHNNTNNAQADVAAGTLNYGPIDHVDHSRVASVSADLSPNEHYGLNFSYSYSSVYTATNICYTNGATATLPGTASTPTSAVPNVYANGVCASVTAYGSTALVDWYARDFTDAPTQYGSVSLNLSPVDKIHYGVGYRISAVSGSQFFTDARSVNGSLQSAYQSPYANVAWTIHPGLIWKAEYNYYGYGEGGPSGPQYCSTSTNSTASVVPCTSLSYPTGLTEPSSGLTASRNFHANNFTLGLHYEF